jgi:hypothetical protein
LASLLLFFFIDEEPLAEQTTLALLFTTTRSTRRGKRDKDTEPNSEVPASPEHPIPDNRDDVIIHQRRSYSGEWASADKIELLILLLILGEL